MNNETPIRAFPIGRAAVMLTLAVGVPAALMGWALHAGGFAEQVRPAAWTAGACIIAAVVSLVPVYLRSQRSAASAASGFLIGIFARIVLCLAAALIFLYLLHFQLMPVALWISSWYMLALFVEVLIIRQYLLHSQHGPAAEPRTENSSC